LVNESVDLGRRGFIEDQDLLIEQLSSDPGLKEIVASQKRDAQKDHHMFESKGSRHNRSFTGSMSLSINPGLDGSHEYSSLSLPASPQTTVGDDSVMRPSPMKASYHNPDHRIKPISNPNPVMITKLEDLEALSDDNLHFIATASSHILAKRNVSSASVVTGDILGLERQLTLLSTASSVSSITDDGVFQHVSPNRHRATSKRTSQLAKYIEEHEPELEELSMMSGSSMLSDETSNEPTTAVIREGAYPPTNFLRSSTPLLHSPPNLLNEASMDDAASAISDLMKPLKTKAGAAATTASDESYLNTSSASFPNQSENSVFSGHSNSNSSSASAKRQLTSARTAFENRSVCSNVSSLSNNSPAPNTLTSQSTHTSSRVWKPAGNTTATGVNSRRSPKRSGLTSTSASSATGLVDSTKLRPRASYASSTASTTNASSSRTHSLSAGRSKK
jgi:hypothetical protein